MGQILRFKHTQSRKQLQKNLNIIGEEGAICSKVNAEWSDMQMADLQEDPFLARDQCLLEIPPIDKDGLGCSSAIIYNSPFAPQPLLGEYGSATRERHMS